MMTIGHESHLPTCHQRQAKLIPKMKLIIGELHGPLQTLMTNHITVRKKLRESALQENDNAVDIAQQLNNSRKDLVFFSTDRGLCVSCTHHIMAHAWESELKFDEKGIYIQHTRRHVLVTLNNGSGFPVKWLNFTELRFRFTWESLWVNAPHHTTAQLLKQPEGQDEGGRGNKHPYNWEKRRERSTDWKRDLWHRRRKKLVHKIQVNCSCLLSTGRYGSVLTHLTSDSMAYCPLLAMAMLSRS